jgi:peptidoglycan/LPS O-acetylase OafA/YrhL
MLLVLFQHWLPGSWQVVDTGAIGVTGFFVLSGYLITGNLRRSKPGNSFWQVAKPFYLRRALRILPAYYAAVAVAWALNLSYVRSAWPWFMLHSTNILFFREQAWGEGVGHFWSLAVEEQFYLVWPLLVLLVPTRFLGRLLVALVIAGPLIRWALLVYTGTFFSSALPFASLDLFAMGALLGWLQGQIRPSAGALLSAGLALLASYVGLEAWGGVVQATLGPSALALLASVVLTGLLYPGEGLVWRVWRWRPFVFLGKISYGMYLYHLFFPVLTYRVLFRLAARAPSAAARQAVLDSQQAPATLVIMFVVLVVAAACSWYLLEQPFRRWQRLFPYPISSPGLAPAATRQRVG